MKKLHKSVLAAAAAALMIPGCIFSGYAVETENTPEIYIESGDNNTDCVLKIESSDCDAFRVRIDYGVDSSKGKMTFNGFTKKCEVGEVVCNSKTDGVLEIAGYTSDYFDGEIVSLDFSGYALQSTDLETEIKLKVISFGTDGTDYSEYVTYDCFYTMDYTTVDPTDPTEPIGWYESQYEISIKNLPDKIAYKTGDKLDLTGLKVNLELYDQHGEHHNIYSRVSPLDNPDAFIVDTSDFNSSKAGTYTIKISCTDKYQSFLLTAPVSFDVEVIEESTDPTEPSTEPDNYIPKIGIYHDEDSSSGDITVEPGGAFTVYLNIESKDCDAFLVTIDGLSGFEYVDCSGNNRCSLSCKPSDDHVAVAGFASSVLDGNVAKLNFKAPQDAQYGDVYVLTCNEIEFGTDGEKYENYMVEPALNICIEENKTNPTEPTDPTEPTVQTTVETAPSQPVSTETQKNAINLELGDKTAIYIPDGPEDVTYVSADSNIASVDGNGIVKAVGNGETQIFVISENTVINVININVTIIFNFGDVTMDEKINIFDAVAVAKYTVGKFSMNDTQFGLADVNKDTNVNIFDAVMIAKHTVGVAFPWE